MSCMWEVTDSARLIRAVLCLALTNNLSTSTRLNENVFG